MIFLKTPSLKRILLVLILLGGGLVCAQTTDIARLEYTYIPQSKSDNQLSRFRGFVNFPIPLGADGSYLVPGIEYRKTTIELDDPVPFDISNLEDFQMFRLSLGYTFKMKKDWRVGMKAGAEIASNFEERKVKGTDLRFTGAFYLIKDRSGDSIPKPDRWIFGLHYSTNAGRPFPIPLVNYFRKFHPNWTYSLGTPKTNVKHYFTQKHALQAFLTVDGFFSNIQSNLAVPTGNNTTQLADNISMTTILGGLGYEYFFTKHILFYCYGGYTVFNEIRLRDEKRNNLFTINQENTFYLRSGFKLKI